MNGKTSAGAFIGLIIGLVFGYLLFNDADNVVLGTVIPTAALGIAAAFVGYFLMKYSTKQRT